MIQLFHLYTFLQTFPVPVPAFTHCPPAYPLCGYRKVCKSWDWNRWEGGPASISKACTNLVVLLTPPEVFYSLVHRRWKAGELGKTFGLYRWKGVLYPCPPCFHLSQLSCTNLWFTPFLPTYGGLGVRKKVDQLGTGGNKVENKGVQQQEPQKQGTETRLVRAQRSWVHKRDYFSQNSLCFSLLFLFIFL
jgi:hypothetical protein